MAIIYSYPLVTSIQPSDLLILSVDSSELPTRQVTVGDLLASGTVDVNLNFTADTGTGSVNLSTQSLEVRQGVYVTTTAVDQELIINHKSTVRQDTAIGDTSPGYGGSFTVIDSVVTDATGSGHVTGVNLKTVTLPAADDTNTTYDLQGYDTGIELVGSDGTRDSIQITGSGGTIVSQANNIITVSSTSGVTGTGTVNTIPIWSTTTDLADSLITQTKINGGTIFDLNAITTGPFTPAINTKLFDLNSGGAQKFSITQDGGGGVVLPAGGGVTNPGPSFNIGGGAFSNGKSGIAMGTTTTAFGNGSLAANFLTLASGGGASAFGLLTEAGALASAAFGNKSKATGNYSIASGQDSIASGQSSVAIGEKGEAQGKNTFVSGFSGTATGNNAVKFGYNGSASGSNSAKFGFESVASGPNSFAIGDGTTASGPQSIATGDNNIASGNNSFAGGKNTTVTGAESIGYGLNNTVSANSCTAFGFGNIITAGSFQSFVVGTDNTTNSFGEVKLIGRGLVGASQEGVYLGKYNDDSDNYNKFQIGNGSGVNIKSNSLSINNAGNVKIPTYGSGTVTGTATYNLSVAADGQIIETPNPNTPDYLSFVCLLSQSGTANPQPNLVLENSLGVSTPYTAFTRVSAGVYNLNAPGKFKSLKTIMFATSGSGPSGTSSNIGFQFIDADNLRITTSGSDNFTKIGIEIRTYN